MGNTGGKRPYRKTMCGWKDNTIMGLKEKGLGLCGLDSFH